MISLEAPSRKRQKTFQEDNLKPEDKKMLEESVEWDTSHNMIPVTNADPTADLSKIMNISKQIPKVQNLQQSQRSERRSPFEVCKPTPIKTGPSDKAEWQNDQTPNDIQISPVVPVEIEDNMERRHNGNHLAEFINSVFAMSRRDIKGISSSHEGTSGKATNSKRNSCESAEDVKFYSLEAKDRSTKEDHVSIHCQNASVETKEDFSPYADDLLECNLDELENILSRYETKHETPQSPSPNCSYANNVKMAELTNGEEHDEFDDLFDPEMDLILSQCDLTALERRVKTRHMTTISNFRRR